MSSKLPSLCSPPLLQYLRKHPQLPKQTWYFIAAVTLTVINRPDEIPIIFREALEHVTGPLDSEVNHNEELKVSRRMREALLKSIPVAGVPKVINACIALNEAVPKHLQDDMEKSTTGRGADFHEMSSSQVIQRGQDFFDKVYGNISGMVTRVLKSSGTEDLDLIAKVMYSIVLSNETLLGQSETSYVLIAALIPQDVNPQLKGHLKGALNGGATVDEVRAVREVVIRICESAGMTQLGGMVGWGWQSEIANV